MHQQLPETDGNSGVLVTHEEINDFTAAWQIIAYFERSEDYLTGRALKSFWAVRCQGSLRGLLRSRQRSERRAMLERSDPSIQSGLDLYRANTLQTGPRQRYRQSLRTSYILLPRHELQGDDVETQQNRCYAASPLHAVFMAVSLVCRVQGPPHKYQPATGGIN